MESSHETAYQTVLGMMQNELPMQFDDRLRLALIYLLRWGVDAPNSLLAQPGRSRPIDVLKQSLSQLAKTSADRQKVSVIDAILQHRTRSLVAAPTASSQALSSSSNNDSLMGEVLASTSTLTKKTGKLFRAALDSVRLPDQNADPLARYRSKFVDLLSNLTQSGKLDFTLYPSAMGAPAKSSAAGVRYSSIILFVVGGVTYHEYTLAESLRSPQCDIVIAGNCIHNSSSFLSEFSDAFMPKSRVANDVVLVEIPAEQAAAAITPGEGDIDVIVDGSV